MVLFKYGFLVVAVSLSQADVLIVMVLDGGITTDSAQDVEAMASVLFVEVMVVIMKYNIDNSSEKMLRCSGRGKCSSCSGQGGRYYTVYK